MDVARIIWMFVKSVIIGVVFGAVIRLGTLYMDHLDAVAVRNRAIAAYNEGDMQRSVLAFDAAWAMDTASASDRETYATAATEAGTLAYEDALRSNIGYDDAYWLLDAAAAHGQLDERRMAYRLDAAINCGEFETANRLLAERRAQGALDGRYPALERKLKQRESYAPKLDKR